MSFLDDILESDDSLAHATVNDDPTVMILVQSAAEEGNLSTLRLALSRGQLTAGTPEALVLKIVGIAGSKLHRLGARDLDQRLDFVQEWVESTLPLEAKSNPQLKQARLNKLLHACLSDLFRMHDSVALRLVAMGAEPGAEVTDPALARKDLSGARLGLSQGRQTALALAIYGESEATTSLVATASRACGAIPAACEMYRHGQMTDTNVVAYAIASGAPRQLERVLAGLDLKNPRIQAQLGEAIGQVMALGLHDFGVDEVHHGIARVLGCGATGVDLQAFTKTPVVVTQSPSLKFYDAEGRIIDGDAPIAAVDFERARRLGLAETFVHCPNPRHVIAAYQALGALGWRPNESVDFHAKPGDAVDLHSKLTDSVNLNSKPSDLVNLNSKPSDLVGLSAAKGAASAKGSDAKQAQASLPDKWSGASMLHLAALRGDLSIIEALRDLGADVNARDAQGRAPVDYAFGGLNRSAAFEIDPVRAQVLATEWEARAAQASQAAQSGALGASQSAAPAAPALKALDQVSAARSLDELNWEPAQAGSANREEQGSLLDFAPAVATAPVTATAPKAAAAPAPVTAPTPTPAPMSTPVAAPVAPEPKPVAPVKAAAAPSSAANMFASMRKRQEQVQLAREEAHFLPAAPQAIPATAAVAAAKRLPSMQEMAIEAAAVAARAATRGAVVNGVEGVSMPTIPTTSTDAQAVPASRSSFSRPG